MPEAAEVLRAAAERGHRLTRPRRRVIEALAGAPEPLSARALHEAVGTDRIDLVTVYRTLDWLMEIGLARPVLTGEGAERVELVPAERHTHHLVCDACGAVRTVSICGLDRTISERIEREHRFTVDHHQLIFHGRCGECSTERGQTGS
ncbi:MAG TPA: Fur family transcriptional regulator [Longimicrobiaceae bacterium]|nr:Fur family transcriptional regulator [Longimicrobiaceae bacterium]